MGHVISNTRRLKPPPYYYRQALVVQVVLTTPCDNLGALIPPEVEASPTGDIAWQIAFFPEVRDLGTYSEAVLLLRVLHRQRLRLFCPRIWVNSALALDAGRKFWNMPKTLGDIRLALVNNMISASVSQHGELFLEMRAELRSYEKPNWNYFLPEAWLIHRNSPHGQHIWQTLSPQQLKIHYFYNINLLCWKIISPFYECGFSDVTLRGASCANIDFILRNTKS